MNLGISPFIYLYNLINKINIDDRLKPAFKDVLISLDKYFEESGLLDTRDYKKLFDDWLLSKKFNIVVSNEPNKTGAAGFYRRFENCIHIDESCFRDEEYLKGSLCHEFIHFLAMHDHKYYKEYEKLLNEGYTEILARKVLGSKKTWSYDSCVKMVDFITKLNDTNINFDKFLRELNFDIDGLSKEFKKCLGDYYDFGNKTNFKIEEAIGNKDYLNAQRTFIRDNIKYINSIDDLGSFMTKLKFRPCEDKDEMNNIYDEISALLSSKLSKSETKKAFLSKHIRKYIEYILELDKDIEYKKDRGYDLKVNNEKNVLLKAISIDDNDFDAAYKFVRTLDDFSKIYKFSIDRDTFKKHNLHISNATNLYVVMKNGKIYVYYGGSKFGEVENFKFTSSLFTDGILYSLDDSLLSPSYIENGLIKEIENDISIEELNKIIEDYKNSNEYDGNEEYVKEDSLVWYIDKKLSNEDREKYMNKLKENGPKLLVYLDNGFPFVGLVDNSNNLLAVASKKILLPLDDKNSLLIREVIKHDFIQDVELDETEIFNKKLFVLHESEVPSIKYRNLYEIEAVKKLINDRAYSDKDAYLLGVTNLLYVEISKKLGFVPQPGNPPAVTLIGNDNSRIEEIIREYPETVSLLKKIDDQDRTDDERTYLYYMLLKCNKMVESLEEETKKPHSLAVTKKFPSLYDMEFYRFQRGIINDAKLLDDFELDTARANLLYYDVINYNMTDDKEFYEERITKALNEEPYLSEFFRNALGVEESNDPKGLSTMTLELVVDSLDKIYDKIKTKK